MKTELQRLISKLGLASRKEANQLILDGLVKVNGQVCLIPSMGFDPRVNIEILGQKINAQEKIYLALNKPRGLIVTRSDERGRSTVFDCLKNWQGPLVQAIGRLDQASEGLLLFSNDHIWSNFLMDPKTHIRKIYHVQISTIPSHECLQRLSDGIILEGKKTLPAKFEILKNSDKNSWISVELTEGRNRQIRKMLELENIKVMRLIRVQIGKLELGPLPKGEWIQISKTDV